MQEANTLRPGVRGNVHKKVTTLALYWGRIVWHDVASRDVGTTKDLLMIAPSVGPSTPDL